MEQVPLRESYSVYVLPKIYGSFSVSSFLLILSMRVWITQAISDYFSLVISLLLFLLLSVVAPETLSFAPRYILLPLLWLRDSCASPLVPYVAIVARLEEQRSLAPTRADLLPPRKRFRDSYSSEASTEEDTEVDPTDTEVDMDLGTSDRDDVRDRVEIDPRDVRDDMEEHEADTSAGDTVKVDGIVRSFEEIPIELDDAVHNFYHHMSEVRIDRIVEIETDQRRLEADQLIASKERARITERIESLRLENLKVRALLCIERDRMDSLRLHMSRSQEEFRYIREDRDEVRRRFGRLESFVERRFGFRPPWTRERKWKQWNGNGDGNGNGNGNGDRNGNNGGDNGDGYENHNVNGRDDRPVSRECTYQDFMKCQPLSFKGIEGVVCLIRWSEKMETVFHISNCPKRYQVKYATCTLLDSALTWWNSHKRTIGTDVAYALSWRELMKLMTEVYCSRNEIQNMETELWNLSVKNNDMATYTQRFQELTMMCTKMVLEEEDRVEKFIGGLPDNIQGNVIAAGPTRLQDVVRIANNLMDKKLQFDTNHRNNRGQQPPHKRQNTRGQNVSRAYTAGNNEKKGYEGPLPYCNKCKFHHEGPCTVRCGKCNKAGHVTRDCR
ncbi:putative reverse transcriptase domain-containing protein, partial [Tanacetum coccineum]